MRIELAERIALEQGFEGSADFQALKIPTALRGFCKAETCWHERRDALRRLWPRHLATWLIVSDVHPVGHPRDKRSL